MIVTEYFFAFFYYINSVQCQEESGDQRAHEFRLNLSKKHKGAELWDTRYREKQRTNYSTG